MTRPQEGNARADQRRQVAREVMAEAEIKKITASDMTVSLKSGAPSVEVLDENRIPATYWEPRPPRLNKQMVLDELKQGAVIPGVMLSTSKLVLSVRTK